MRALKDLLVLAVMFTVLGLAVSCRAGDAGQGGPVRLPAVADREVPGPAGAIPVRIYTPGTGKVYPVVVYYHGGGWFMGSIETHDVICRKLAVKTPSVVVSVD